jgi:starch synthase
MNILLASAEVAPLAKAGGLADIASALPIEWKKKGHNTIVIMPKYRFIDIDYYGFKPTELVLYVPLSDWTEFARLWVGKLPGSDVDIYLVENNDYFNRSGIYGDPNEYHDNDRRFIFFSRAVFEAAKALNFKPDILHAHDYHTAFTMAFLKTFYKHDPLFARTAGVYTIHNLAYQGFFNPESAMKYSQFGMKDYYHGSWFEHRGAVNAMKVGIMFADKITTVSPTYADEIRFPYYSEGMQDVLNYRASDLIGVLNGVYYDEWNPTTDKYLSEHYGIDYLEGKRSLKHKFLKEHGLTENDDLDKPLIGIVTRLAEQKGIDLLIHKLEEYLVHNTFRFIILGSGESRYEDYFRYLLWKYPGKALIHLGYNNSLSHKIHAASDFFLIPSRYEPCGLTQMYSLKYGTIPIVRHTGGLADTVFEYNLESGEGNGFVFFNYNADDFSFAINRALSIYHNYPHWDRIRHNAMKMNFSSENCAEEYIKVFQWALDKLR